MDPVQEPQEELQGVVLGISSELGPKLGHCSLEERNIYHKETEGKQIMFRSGGSGPREQVLVIPAYSTALACSPHNVVPLWRRSDPQHQLLLESKANQRHANFWGGLQIP